MMDPQALGSQILSLHEVKDSEREWHPRASNLYSECMRKLVLCKRLHKKVRPTVSLRDRLVYGFGNAAHYWAQNDPDFLFGGKLVGSWKCRACQKVVLFGDSSVKQKSCPNCNANGDALVYHEYSFHLKSPVTVSGHIDAFIKFNGSVHVGELKTINGPDFDSLKAPLVAHIWQATTYLLVASADKKLPVTIDPERAFVFYLTKLIRPGEFPLKAFEVRRSKRIEDLIKEKLFKYQHALRDKTTPDRDPTCQRNPRSYKVRECPAAKECF